MNETLPSTPESSEKWEIQLRKGSLELAILAALWAGRLYGLEILRHLETNSDMIVVEGTVYPLLSRLRGLGFVESEWVESEFGHPRKYYRLTPAGRQRAVEMSRIWARFSASMNDLLAPLSEETNGERETTKTGIEKTGEEKP
ncbi:MAG: helix-turn-helix transcriptional regulator [Terracidiphilus sp.]